MLQLKVLVYIRIKEIHFHYCGNLLTTSTLQKGDKNMKRCTDLGYCFTFKTVHF